MLADPVRLLLALRGVSPRFGTIIKNHHVGSFVANCRDVEHRFFQLAKYAHEEFSMFCQLVRFLRIDIALSVFCRECQKTRKH